MGTWRFWFLRMSHGYEFGNDVPFVDMDWRNGIRMGNSPPEASEALDGV